MRFLGAGLTAATGSGFDFDNVQISYTDDTWVERVIPLGSIDYTLAGGRRLVMLVVVDDASGDNMWLAHDTTAYPSRLEVLD